jgi:hypothetical protein
MEKKTKIKVTQKQIEMLAESEMERLKKEDIEKMIGDPEDRRIEYPTPGDVEALKTGEEMPGGDEEEMINPAEMKSPPHELLDYLDKIEEAKSILSKIAAKEDNENIKNRIYAHYEKAQKLAFEMIKEFGIVH